MSVFPLDQLGGRQVGPSVLAFGVLLPWVTPGNGQSVDVLVIHEADQYLQGVPAVEVPLKYSVDPGYGDLWSGNVDVSAPAGQPAGSRWGTPGRYVYRLAITDPGRGRIDWVIDPCARDFGVGKQSAVVLGGQPFTWSPADGAWRVPALRDLAMYEINLAEFHVDLDGAIERLDYLADLGVNCLSIMPVTNVASEVDWGYLPVGYFGVDERFGGNDKFRTFVDAAHARGLAVIVDAVYGHASRALFAYQYLYDQLGYDQNPFMGPFAKDYFADQGASTDYARPLTQDFFLAVNLHWLQEFHVDGFRYDCVPNYWDGATGVGYAKLVSDTRELVAKMAAAGELPRFSGADALPLIQCAEQLEDPVGVLGQSYSDATWQDGTLWAARAVAHGEDGAIDRLGQALGLPGFPTEVTLNGQVLPRTALQYLETHDHPRLLAEFGTLQPDEAGNDLFAVGDRSRWYKLQPYLISLICAKGIPMLYEGEELAEDFTLPGNGIGRVALLRPVNWDYFYDNPGRSLVSLTRKLLGLRRQRADLRQGDHWYYSDTAAYQDRGVMIFRRSLGTDMTIIAVNFTDAEATVPFLPPAPGLWTDRLDGQASFTAGPGQEIQLTIPSNYGRIWVLS
jgi:maltooligosyltrehalose trehalohydrolase